MVEKEIDEIRRMGRSGKQNPDGAKSKKVKDKIENAGRGRGKWTTGLRNVEGDGKSLRSLGAARNFR
jgi:hypothetical protein